MPKYSILLNSMNTGEVSKLIEARSDISKFSSACQTLENAIPLVEGGAKKMPGTYFIWSTKYGGAKKSLLAPFAFSTTQEYMLEIGHEYIRFFINRGLVTNAIASATPNFVPGTSYTAAQLVKVGGYVTVHFTTGVFFSIASPYGQFGEITVPITVGVNTSDALSVSVIGNIPNQGISILLADTTAANNSAANIQAAIRGLGTLNGSSYNTIDLTGWIVAPSAGYVATPPIATTAQGPLYLTRVAKAYIAMANNVNEFPPEYPTDWHTAASTGVTVEVVTPYLEADLFDLDVGTQSADVLYIFHHSYPPAKLMRYSNEYWVLKNLNCRGTDGEAKIGYGNIGLPITAANKADPVLITVGAAHNYVDNQRVYINGMAGMVGLNQGEFLVTVHDYNSFYLKDPDSGVDINTTGFSTYVSGGFVVAVDPMFTTAGNYPSCGTFYQQRLIVAGTDNNPQELFGSVQGDFENFICDPTAIDHAIQFTIVSSKIDRIRWMISQMNLMLGTVGGVWQVAGSNSEALSQTNVDVTKQISIGVANIRPQIVNDSMIWVTRAAKVVRLMQYVWQSNQWISPDLTRLARHITIGATAALSGIVQTAFQAEPYPILWAVRADGQLLGMTYESQEQVYAWFRIVTDGVIESVACISRDNDEDQVWITVKRTVNNATVRYQEYFTAQKIFSQLNDAFFVHSGLTYNGAPTATVTGLSHLEGETVVALGDGANIGTATVTGGSATFSSAASIIHVGLPFITTIVPMNPVINSQGSTSRGKKQKINRATFCFYETVGCKMGMNVNTLYDIPFGVGQQPSLFTGDMTLDLPGDWDDQASLAIVHDSPTPFTLKAIVPDLNVSEA